MELAIVGGGPAGLSAACEASAFGVDTWVFDEQSAPGGQLIKQIHKFFGSSAHMAGRRGIDIGDSLRKRAEAQGVHVCLNTVVFGYNDGNLAICDGRGVKEVKAERIIIATGASENVLRFPGWTLPGVMGAGAAQTMMNVHRVKPGRRVLMVGAGNVGLIVTYQMLQAGIDVVAVVEAKAEVGGYEVHAAKIRRAGVPVLTSHTIVKACGEESVESVVIARCGPDFKPIPGTERELKVDTVCLAVGLNPLTELTQLIGCRHEYDAALGGWIPSHDDRMETSVPGVYVAGDLTGIEEATVAMEEGRIAGISAAESLGKVSADKAAALRTEAIGRLTELRSCSFGRYGPGSGFKPTRAADKPGGEIDLSGGLGVIVECDQDIPCDPCEKACPTGAIKVGAPITNLPTVNQSLCTGCGSCVAACPGLAVFLVDTRKTEGDKADVTLPYEYLPVPEVGNEAAVVDRDGKTLGKGRIVRALASAKYDRTTLVTVRVDKAIALRVRGIARQ
ncbi:MAG: FAD-dependent oxidoreductase [Firmicutes bacterium]|nr:FAD-dependent oxidoreductase [Bacillota bacterium]